MQEFINEKNTGRPNDFYSPILCLKETQEEIMKDKKLITPDSTQITFKTIAQSIRSYFKQQNDCFCNELMLEMLKLFVIFTEKLLKEKEDLCSKLKQKEITWKEEVTAAITKHTKPLSANWHKIKMGFAIKEGALRKKFQEEKVCT